MSLTFEEIEKIAKLARLDLTDQEKNSLKLDLSAVLDYFQKLQKLDTSKVNLDITETENSNAMRDDVEVEEVGVLQKKILDNAPLKEDRFIRVKAILK